MNIKILKIIVIFFGILIIFGLITLTIGIYHKFANLKKNNSNSDTITLKKLDNYKVENFYIDGDTYTLKAGDRLDLPHFTLHKAIVLDTGVTCIEGAFRTIKNSVLQISQYI